MLLFSLTGKATSEYGSCIPRVTGSTMQRRGSLPCAPASLTTSSVSRMDLTRGQVGDMGGRRAQRWIGLVGSRFFRQVACGAQASSSSVQLLPPIVTRRAFRRTSREVSCCSFPSCNLFVPFLAFWTSFWVSSVFSDLFCVVLQFGTFCHFVRSIPYTNRSMEPETRL